MLDVIIYLLIFLSSRRRHTRCELVTGVQTCALPIFNTRDIPGYFLNTQAQARAVLEAVAADNVGLQFDFYHVQIVEGDLAKTFEKHLDVIRHVQIAGVPERHEPSVGEINFPYLFDLMDRLGYDGWVEIGRAHV